MSDICFGENKLNIEMNFFLNQLAHKFHRHFSVTLGYQPI